MGKGSSFFSVFLGFLFGVWVVTLWILSSLPGQDIHLPPFPEADKVAHFDYFFTGGFLLAWLLRRRLGWRGGKLLCGALCTIALIGVLDELHQLYTPDRSGGDPADWTADCAGGALGALVIVGSMSAQEFDDPRRRAERLRRQIERTTGSTGS
jgi:VanZ family protein